MSFLNRSTISHKALELSAFEDTDGVGLIKPLVAHQLRAQTTNSGGSYPINADTFIMNLTPDFAGTTGRLELTRNLEPTSDSWYVGDTYSSFSIIATIRNSETSYGAYQSPAYYHRIIGGITDYSSDDNTPIISWTQGSGDLFLASTGNNILSQNTNSIIQQVQTIVTPDSTYFYRVVLNGLKGARPLNTYVWKVTFKLF